MILWYVLAAVLLFFIGVVVIRRRGMERAAGAGDVGFEESPTAKRVSTEPLIGTSVPFSTDAIKEAKNAVYKMAFGVARIDYEILGEHRRVLTAIEGAIGTVAKESRYFPRRPSLLPKLLRAINSSSSGRNEIVRLILQDAALAGNVLTRANSAYYNQNKEIIESVDRAVAILGNEGLRAPVASAVMQPVFLLPAGFFEQFAPTTWELARRTAIAAEQFARTQRSADAFVAHLAGMLDGLGRIVLFRLTMDKYREQKNLMPRTEVFIKVMSDHSQSVARAIAAAWEMSPPFLEALDAQIARRPPEQMSPLALTLYFANLCGMFATLCKRGSYSEATARDLLIAQGLDVESCEVVWKAATSDID
jgi:HD-like signal output (HDOD) protein